MLGTVDSESAVETASELPACLPTNPAQGELVEGASGEVDGTLPLPVVGGEPPASMPAPGHSASENRVADPTQGEYCEEEDGTIEAGKTVERGQR